MRREYTPIRDVRAGCSLGMNAPKGRRRFGTMREAFARDACYWGEHGEWYIVAAQTRDSESLDRSNFQVLTALLGGESDTVRIERANHWACGWVEYLIVAPSDRKALREAIYAHCSAYDYPILDEMHWSQLEYDEAYECAERELKGFPGWEEVFREEAEGFSEDEAWSAIERARERLEATPTECTCDDSHRASDTVCAYCLMQGKRGLADHGALTPEMF